MCLVSHLSQIKTFFSNLKPLCKERLFYRRFFSYQIRSSQILSCLCPITTSISICIHSAESEVSAIDLHQVLTSVWSTYSWFHLFNTKMSFKNVNHVHFLQPLWTVIVLVVCDILICILSAIVASTIGDKCCYCCRRLETTMETTNPEVNTFSSWQMRSCGCKLNVFYPLSRSFRKHWLALTAKTTFGVMKETDLAWLSRILWLSLTLLHCRQFTVQSDMCCHRNTVKPDWAILRSVKKWWFVYTKTLIK